MSIPPNNMATPTKSSICSPKLLLLFFLLSAVPISYLISLEFSLSSPPIHTYSYHSTGYLRECVKWDDLNRRFLVSFFEGGVGQIKVPEDDDGSSSVVLEETRVVDNGIELAGNASLGMVIDGERKRVLVVIADVFGNKYNGLAAYDLGSWKRLFLTQLTGPDDEKSFADDVAVDAEGNAYVTDAKSSKLWKLSVDGKLLTTIRNPLFTHKQWYNNLISLNGILYHPDGYLLVLHTATGKLYKVILKTGEHEEAEEVKLVKVVKGSLRFGDGMEFVSKDKIAVAGNPSARLVESKDGWETAAVVGKFVGPVHRFATGVTVKDDRVYVSHLVGLGYPKKKHVLVEALFKDL